MIVQNKRPQAQRGSWINHSVTCRSNYNTGMKMVPDGQNHYFIRMLGLLVISARKLIHVQSSFNILEPLDTLTHDQAIPFTNRTVVASLVIKHFGVGAINVHHRLY